MRPVSTVLSILLFCTVGVTWASPIIYSVTVDTSSIAGTVGSLDFNFNPGPLLTQSASLQILSFMGDGTLSGEPQAAGDVSGGPLPFTVTFGNGAALNDYFEGFTFGSMISFDVSLYGPALSSPDGVSTSGSTFAFSMFSDAAGTVPVLTTDMADGFAFTVNVNLNGTTTVTDFSAQTTIVPVTSGTPEPSYLLLVGASLVGSFVLHLRRGGRDNRSI